MAPRDNHRGVDVMSEKTDPNKYPIHVSGSGAVTIYLCGDKLQYTPPPVRLMGNSDWHDKRPLCSKCASQHFAQFGEVITWPLKQ